MHMIYLVSTAALFATGYTLTCYNGFSVIRGQSVGTSQEECPNESDSCYRVVADVNLFSTVKKAGCSTYRCYVSCFRQRIKCGRSNIQEVGLGIRTK